MTIIERLDALYAKATHGIWGVADGNFIVHGFINDDPNTGTIVAEVPCQGANDNDLPYIAALHNAYPELRARIEALEAALDTISGGWTSRFPGAPNVMTATSPAEFQAAMWTWSQKVARAALAGSAT